MHKIHRLLALEPLVNSGCHKYIEYNTKYHADSYLSPIFILVAYYTLILSSNNLIKRRVSCFYFFVFFFKILLLIVKVFCVLNGSHWSSLFNSLRFGRMSNGRIQLHSINGKAFY